MKEPPYKITVRKGLGPGNWQDFRKVIFEVSLDNKRYKGNAFFSILDWARTRFDTIHIIVCDTLQRYNICFDQKTSESDAKHLAKKKGDQWIQAAQPYFGELGLTPEITRWADWLSYNPTLYNEYHQALKNLYNTDQMIQKEINKICDNVWQRRKKQENLNPALEKEFKNKVILPYFFEETALSAVFIPIVKGVSAYPGSLPPLWNLFIEGKVDTLKGFRGHTFINLDLKRR